MEDCMKDVDSETDISIEGASMTVADTETEAVISQYSKQLVAEAEIAHGDLAEIEDHLRTLADDLRGRGMPAAEAVTEAARRLGDPKHLAREHARVRSPFGARLSPARAWSAALLIAPPFAWSFARFAHYGINRFLVECVIALVLSVGLVARVSWVRPVFLGAMALFVLSSVFSVIEHGVNPVWLVWHIGVVAFLMPWRRGEIAPAGWALALQVWSYFAASVALGYQFTNERGEISIVMPFAVAALLCAALGAVGGVLRARWGAVTTLVSALCLWAVAGETLFMRFRFTHPTLLGAYLGTVLVSGAIAASIAAGLAQRTARSTFGTLRHVLH
jgi:hypothetical protein